jgi:hypothetical protein
MRCASFTLKGNTRLGTVIACKVLQMKLATKVDHDRKPEDPKGDFPEAHKEVNYIFSRPDSYESRRK